MFYPIVFIILIPPPNQWFLINFPICIGVYYTLSALLPIFDCRVTVYMPHFTTHLANSLWRFVGNAHQHGPALLMVSLSSYLSSNFSKLYTRVYFFYLLYYLQVLLTLYPSSNLLCPSSVLMFAMVLSLNLSLLECKNCV
jgi:hypothetical protein